MLMPINIIIGIHVRHSCTVTYMNIRIHSLRSCLYAHTHEESFYLTKYHSPANILTNIDVFQHTHPYLKSF